MSGRSYLDLSEEEQDAREIVPAPPIGEGTGLPDLSAVQPTPVVRTEELHDAVEEGRRRGFGGPVARAPAKPARATRQSRKGRKPTSEGAVKRYIVSLAEEAPEGVQGQIALSGEARVLYDFIRRAHFERRSRGELLADLMAIYVREKGPTPKDF